MAQNKIAEAQAKTLKLLRDFKFKYFVDKEEDPLKDCIKVFRKKQLERVYDFTYKELGSILERYVGGIGEIDVLCQEDDL